MIEQLAVPRGCEVVPNKGFRGAICRFFKTSKVLDRTAWEKQWVEKEDTIRAVYEQIVRHYLSHGYDTEPEAAELLSQVDGETQLSYKILLAQGLQSLGQDRLVLITSNQLGIGGNGRSIAAGGTMEFSLKYPLPRVIRRVEGRLVGVVLNTKSRVASLRDGMKAVVPGEEVKGVLSSIIEARRALIWVESNGQEREYFTQKELSQAIDWVRFSGPTNIPALL